MDTQTIKQTVITQAAEAKIASRKLALLSTETKNKVLIAMAEALAQNKDDILFITRSMWKRPKNPGLPTRSLTGLPLTRNVFWT